MSEIDKTARFSEKTVSAGFLLIAFAVGLSHPLIVQEIPGGLEFVHSAGVARLGVRDRELHAPAMLACRLPCRWQSPRRGPSSKVRGFSLAGDAHRPNDRPALLADDSTSRTYAPPGVTSSADLGFKVRDLGRPASPGRGKFPHSVGVCEDILEVGWGCDPPGLVFVDQKTAKGTRIREGVI